MTNLIQAWDGRRENHTRVIHALRNMPGKTPNDIVAFKIFGSHVLVALVVILVAGVNLAVALFEGLS